MIVSAAGGDCVRVGPGGFGVRTTEGRTTIKIPEYKGITATLDTTPRPTRFEGPAAQGTPAYVRERVLTDPRVAAYFAENPDLWQRVKVGEVDFDIRVIATSDLDAGPFATAPVPFTLTPQVEQALDTVIQHPRTRPGKDPLP